MRYSLVAALLVALFVAPVASAAPKPKLRQTVVVKPAGGVVKVKPRGKREFRLRKATAIKLGARIDTTKGKVRLTSAKRSKGTQSGVFSKGAFVVSQQSDGLTDLKLTGGDFSGCATAARAKKPVTGAAKRRRRLFGNAHGRFRTRGRNSSATVRGTSWTTEDSCKGTVVKNTSDSETSQVETQTGGDLKQMLEPGWTATYYCNTSSIQPDTYCVVLVAKPAEGLLGTGIITQAARDEYALCVREPGSAGNCFAFPLSEPDADGFRQSIVACALRQPGRYDVGWSFEYTQEGGVTSLLYPGVLSLELTAPAPADYCEAHPPGQPAS